MRLTRVATLAALAAGYAACGGPSNDTGGVKSPEELMEERLDKAETEEAEDTGPVDHGVLDEEKKRQFELDKYKVGLLQAQRSAEDCAGVVSEDGPRGVVTVTVTLGNNGHVTNSSISSEFDGTAIGKCVLRAFNAVIGPPYDGDPVTVDWEVDLSEKEGGAEAEKN